MRRKGRIGKGRGRVRKLLYILIGAGALCFGGLLLLVIRAERLERPLERADAILVLGARVQPDGELSTQLMYRAEKALELYRAGLGEVIVATGARGSDEPIAEAAAVAEYLIARGVPEERVLIENRSTSTAENLAFSKAILSERGFVGAIVVTSEYHVQRALWMARDIGLSAQGAGSQASDYPALLWASRAREALAWAKYFALDRPFR